MQQAKSAKDIAFEKERNKLKKEIRELERQLIEKNQLLAKNEAEIKQREEELLQKIAEQEEWIERLLEYTELSKEDLQEVIEGEKTKAEVANKIKQFASIGDALFGLGRY